MSDPVANNSKTTHKGFQKGVSGNPSGRPKKTKQQKDALEAIRQLAPNAAEVLREMLDPSSHTPPQVRIKAVQLVLDRAYGKPQQSVSIDTPKAQALDDIRAELDAMRGDMHD